MCALDKNPVILVLVGTVLAPVKMFPDKAAFKRGHKTHKQIEGKKRGLIVGSADQKIKIFKNRIKKPPAAHNKSTEREVFYMTEKELLYVEDALGHEQHFQSEWQNTTQRLQDEDLKRFTHEQQQKHRQIFQSFYDLL